MVIGSATASESDLFQAMVHMYAPFSNHGYCVCLIFYFHLVQVLM